ncbi:MAG: ATP-binding protein [Xanthomonadales bacterium]|jgi:dedicated sortase system histidine kinase|nr:ATP-binding protein [Xanthomonadales bacterium]
MKLRTKLLALSLLTLLLPWSAWKLLQELEGFLREAQEETLMASARTMVGVIPVGFQTQLLFLPERYLPVRPLGRLPALDGYNDDWPHAEQGLVFGSSGQELTVRVMAGSHRGSLYLLMDLRAAARAEARVRIRLLARDPRGLFSYTIEPQAPGPLQLSSERGGTGQMEGFWLDRENGYRVELALPLSARDTDIAFAVEELTPAGGTVERSAGTLSNPAQPAWIDLLPPWQDVSDWLARSEVASSRTWLVDPAGWVLADSGAGPGAAEAGTQRTTWLQRSLYGLVAGSHPEPMDERPENPVRFEGELIERTLGGEESSAWAQDLETAVVWNTVSVPVMLQGRVRGAIVMQSTSEGLLLMTNRALSRLLLTTLALTLLLALGLWIFATRLSRRVQRLSGAVSEAMEDRSEPGTLPLVHDRDELGELARNNEKLLRAVTGYGQYLQTLASKLSHELKTPLAITRSSLDNLSARDLDPQTRRFLERAREGVDRQAAIVRAMSEASRLEASIEGAEWDEVDLGQLVMGCAEGYRAVHEGRRLEVRVPQAELQLKCAPDLLAQALDKLVDNALSLSGEEDEVTIAVEPGDGCLDLVVRNTGSRLPDELQERLFDSLVSLRDKRGAGPHLGLGLYIVRLVAAAHGGKVTTRNLPADGGVEFRISLPL